MLVEVALHQRHSNLAERGPVLLGVCDREALQAERHALATRVAELERQLAAFQPAAQVTAPSSRAGSMDISAA